MAEIHEQDMRDNPGYRREREQQEAEDAADIADAELQEAAMWQEQPQLMKDIAGHIAGQHPMKLHTRRP